MAVTSIHSIKTNLSGAIAYIVNGDKTVNGLYVSSYLCGTDSRGAAEDFSRIRKQGTGRTSILAYHIIQSFKPEEITPEDALAVSEELCDRYLKGRYQYVLAVHSDHEHLHTHIIFNNTNVYNHLSFTTEENQGGRRERAWAKLRQISDEICREHGLSVVEEPEKGMGVSHYERDMQIEGKSWKEKLRHKLAKAIMKSFSFEDFLRRCKKKGIEVVYEPTHKHKIKYRLEGQQRFVRGETLGEFYTADAIAEQIEIIYKTAEENMRKANAEPAPKPTPTVTAPKIEPITEPKPTITAVPKTEPTAAPSERGGVVYNALLEAMRKRGMELPTTTEPVAPTTAQPTLSIPTPITTEPKSVDTATKPSEKKEDKWEGIRGLRNADAMIAELEAAGVESLDVLRSFFWNAKHKDDHSTELVSLRKQFNAIDTLIAKMKHRDELAPIYKEYQGKTGWSQSRFKKKNADAIEDYEQTVAYIKEHRKPFMVDGKPPTLLDLMDRSNRLKTTYNTLMEEHSRFIAKKTAADKYTKTVRSYLLKKEADRQNAQNRQRDISRKKTYLE